MRKSFHLLSDILEMLDCDHQIDSLAIAGNGTGRFAKPTIDGVRVSLHHDDLDCAVVRVIVWDKNMILCESEINDPFNGELVAEFVNAVLVRMADRVEVK
jgi:hypothetical protein